MSALQAQVMHDSKAQVQQESKKSKEKFSEAWAVARQKQTKAVSEIGVNAIKDRVQFFKDAVVGIHFLCQVRPDINYIF